jgi:hypothetical protein
MSSINADLAVGYSMGIGGFGLVTSTAAQTGNYTALQVVAPTVFTSISGNGVTGTWTGTTIPAGIVIVGPITGFQLTSGSVIAYRGVINS